MPPAALATSNRYIHPGTAVTYFLPAVATLGSPSRVEIDAGTDLTGEVADAPGWAVSANRVPAPDLKRKFTSRIAGRIDPEDSQFMFYADKETTDIRSLLSRGDQGFILIAHGGDVEGRLYDIYPVEVVAISKPLNVGGDPAQITVDFAITSEPAEDVPLPALA